MAQVLNKTVGPIGYGMLGLSWRTQPPPLEQAIAALKAAFNNGATFWNGAEAYGTPEYNSMTILKAYFDKYPGDADKVTLIIKGITDPVNLAPDGSPEGVRKSIDRILEALGPVKKLDLIGISRRDQKVPFETTLKTIQTEYVDTGKVGGISLSEVSANSIEEAVKHVNIAAVEAELSMFTQDNLHNSVAATCAKYNIPLAAYSPMGRGILAGRFKKQEETKQLGFIGTFPRFQGEAFAHNVTLVEKLKVIAEKKGCTLAQLAIAWSRSIGKRPGMPVIIPIPGATTEARVNENCKLVDLTDAELKELDAAMDGFEAAGARYPEGVPTII